MFPIIKLFFDKSQKRRNQASKDFDNYLKQHITPHNQFQTLKEIVINIKRYLFETSSPYRQIISKGDMSIFFPIFHSLRSFQNVDPSIYFTLIEPLLSLTNRNKCKHINKTIKEP